jgi:hypothetical protein
MPGEDSHQIQDMRARAEQCRRLAGALTDRRSADALVKMAEEIEGELARIDTCEVPNPMPPTPQV